MEHQTNAQPATGEHARAAAFTVAVEPFTPNLPAFLALVAPAPDAPHLAHEGRGLVALDSAGALAFTALRDADGVLVGGAMSHVFVCPHYQLKSGATELLVVPDDDAAGEMTSALLDATEADLKARGVKRWWLVERHDAPHAIAPAHHGFQAVEQQHVMGIA